MYEVLYRQLGCLRKCPTLTQFYLAIRYIVLYTNFDLFIVRTGSRKDDATE
jgi:hypothetical protein